MDRVAAFVDAGYLFAQGSKEISGRQLRRGETSLDHQALIRALKAFAEKISGLPLLRIYWYDGTSQGPTPQHNTLADRADMKVRLGFVNSAGQQKGVDSLIVTDMISLARNHAMADCLLLSGDEDLRVGVQQAQGYGVRVHLLGIRPARGSQSLFLLREADSSHEWSSDVLRTFLECGPDGVEPMDVDGRSGSPAPASSHATESVLPDRDGQSDHGRRTLRQVARRVADDVPLADVPSLVVLWDVTLTGATQEQIDARRRDIHAPAANDVRVHNEGEIWRAVTADLKSYDASAAARLHRNHILSGVGAIPEHWSGGGGDVNRATAAEMGDPAHKQMAMRQQLWAEILRRVARYVIWRRLDPLGLSAPDPADPDPELEPAVEWPEMVERDVTRHSTALQQTVAAVSVALGEGLLGAETAARLVATVAERLGIEIDPAAELRAAAGRGEGEDAFPAAGDGDAGAA